MGTHMQDMESPAEESVFYLVGNGKPLQVFLKRELLTIGWINTFEKLSSFCFFDYFIKLTKQLIACIIHTCSLQD